MLLEYLMANNLPFAHADSPSLAKLLSNLCRCETYEPTSETHHSMRAALDEVYPYQMEKLKSRLALTLDECKSGNDYDFLTVTLHFHNDDFKSEMSVILFKILNDDLSYICEVLYGVVNSVLNESDIE